MPMRLLWITEHYDPASGGMARSCDRIVHRLRKQHEVEIDLIHLTAGLPNETAPEPWQNVGSGRDRKWPVGDDCSHDLRVLAGHIQRESKQTKWHAVVAFGGELPIILAPAAAGWIGAPLLTLLRGNDFDTALFSQRRQQPLLNALERSAAVCAVTREMAARVQSMFPRKNVVPIANGIDLDSWPRPASAVEAACRWRQSMHIEPDQLVIGLIGYLRHKKGVVAWIEAMAESGADIHLMMLGSQDGYVSAALAGAHNQLSYSRYSLVAPGELIPYYLRCDFIALPSLYDGMPNVLLEAGALGIPVIASDAAGMPEVLQHRDNGLLFDPFDPRGAAAALEEAAAYTPSERQSMGRCLRDRIATEFTAGIETQNYLRTLKTLL